jgi:hypothetical protein
MNDNLRFYFHTMTRHWAILHIGIKSNDLANLE